MHPLQRSLSLFSLRFYKISAFGLVHIICHSITLQRHSFFLLIERDSTNTASLFLPGQENSCQHQCSSFTPPLCSLLINRDFAWLNFKRPLEKTALLGRESLNHSSELQIFKSQGIMRLPNGKDKIQQYTNYVKN